MRYNPATRKGRSKLLRALNGGETWEYDAGTHLRTNVASANQVGATSGATIFYDARAPDQGRAPPQPSRATGQDRGGQRRRS